MYKKSISIFHEKFKNKEYFLGVYENHEMDAMALNDGQVVKNADVASLSLNKKRHKLNANIHRREAA